MKVVKHHHRANTILSEMTKNTCEVGSHRGQETIVTHFHLGICPHNISNRLTAPRVQVLSYKVTGNLHIHEAKGVSGQTDQQGSIQPMYTMKNLFYI